ncbi:ABC transporter permease [Halalkalibacter oceani]|uniref:ABC transporter permease n=1 Tax=Halalkalibacter oceani TaxID=1653776 RepID=A0A9X2IN55_9BACI|nr:ABC transporter permease [Halalkalibacter oceani]MCM3713436.1 ABC transporter permease [Halalkalibacter oceani]
MGRIIARRVPIIILSLFLLSMFLFFLVRFIPGSPEMVILLQRGGSVNEEELNEIRRELGLDASLFQQYWEWIGNLARLDFGLSYQSGLPVMEEIGSRSGHSLSLILISLIGSITVGMLLAFFAALYKDSKWDVWVRNIAIFLSSLPTYFISLLLVLFFSIHLRLLPVFGNDSSVHFILPVATISLSLVAMFVPLFRQIFGEVMGSLYFEAMRARGAKRLSLYGTSLLKPSIHGMLTIIASSTGSLWGAIIVTENIFALPGLGSYIISSISARDYSVIIGFTMSMAFFTMILYLIIDLLLYMVDPRKGIREEND